MYACKTRMCYTFHLIVTVSLLMSVYSVCDILHMSVIIHVQNGNSPLMEAAATGKTNVVVELLSAGADINLQNKVCQ